jgi:uncharacterized cupin superfamily protein
MDNERYRRTADWDKIISIVPRRCYISNRWILGRHYRGIRLITGPGEPVVLTYWHHREEHLIWLLQGEL